MCTVSAEAGAMPAALECSRRVGDNW